MIGYKGTSYLSPKKIIGVANGAVVANRLYAVDVTGTIGTSPDTNLATIVEPSALNMHGDLVLADTAVAAGGTGIFTLVGKHSAVVTATAIAEGDSLIASPASNVLSEGDNNSARATVAIALEPSTAGADTTMLVYFNGEGMFTRYGTKRVNDATIVVSAEVSNVRTITIQLLDERGQDLTVRAAVMAYVMLDANPDAFVATGGSTGIAIGTDGALLALVAKKAFVLVSEADGDIDLTWTDTGTEAAFLMLVLPNGRTIISAALTNT